MSFQQGPQQMNGKNGWSIWLELWCMMVAFLEFMLLRIALIFHSDRSYCTGQITSSEQGMCYLLIHAILDFLMDSGFRHDSGKVARFGIMDGEVSRWELWLTTAH